MVALDPVPVGEAAVAVASPQVALGSLAALGLLGVTDWILGDDEPPEGTEEPTRGSGMFEDAETAGDGGVAGGAGGDDAGDEFAFDDDGADDGFGDFDVDGMDEAEGGGGGTQVRELERRVEEMEDELSGISSTVSTVRTENEQISESVDDIEENVRKLLDIYKMVTKGVNPFVDEDGGGGVAGEDASLGLFDQDDDEQEDGQLDEDVTDADAEEFFDDDFEEDETFDDEPTEDEETDQAMAQSDDAPDEEGGAKSFDELREEYEDGAEWSEEDDGDAAADEDPEADDEPDDEAHESEVDGEDEPAEPAESAADPDEGADAEAADEAVDDERVDALFEADAATDDGSAGAEDGAHQPAPGPAAQQGSRAPPRTGARQPVTGGAPGEKPYLRELPSGYVSDLLVMEWVEFLVTESSPAGAHRAITYYENVGWVGHRAADQLREFVDGHPEASAGDEDGDAALTMDHHTTSLRYVARITGDVQENVLASWDDGDNRWLQR